MTYHSSNFALTMIKSTLHQQDAKHMPQYLEDISIINHLQEPQLHKRQVTHPYSSVGRLPLATTKLCKTPPLFWRRRLFRIVLWDLFIGMHCFYASVAHCFEDHGLQGFIVDLDQSEHLNKLLQSLKQVLFSQNIFHSIFIYEENKYPSQVTIYQQQPLHF